MENYITTTNLSKEWNSDDPGNYGRIPILPILVKIYGGILAGKFRNWLLYQRANSFSNGIC
jgi:hypothetical protein